MHRKLTALFPTGQQGDAFASRERGAQEQWARQREREQIEKLKNAVPADKEQEAKAKEGNAS